MSIPTTPRKTAPRPTLSSVAKLTGVSPATASLVLNGKAPDRGIPPETVERVLRGAEELNYIPNLLVRSLRRGHTNVVSFYSAFRHHEPGDLYTERLTARLMIAGGQSGMDVLIHCNFDRSTRETFEFLSGGFADGVIFFAPQQDDPLLNLLREGNLPVVLLNGRDSMSHFPAAYADNEAGMRMVADALLNAGHKRVAVFTVSGGYRDATQRIELLRGFLGEAGVELREDRIQHLEYDRTRTVARLMSEPDPPTAIFCWHDRVAYWALDACSELGIDVPGQLSVVGYDGIHWPARTHHVAASVVVSLDELASSAMGLLKLYMKGYSGPLIEEAVPITFSSGSTLAPPPFS